MRTSCHGRVAFGPQLLKRLGAIFITKFNAHQKISYLYLNFQTEKRFITNFVIYTKYTTLMDNKMSLSRPKFQPYETLCEANYYAEKSLPRMGATTVRVAPLLLEVPLFSVARSQSGTNLDCMWNKPGRGFVRYRGPALSQSHQTLFLALVHIRAGQPIANAIDFYPHELLEFMGWSINSRNTERLASMIEDLFTSRLDVWGPTESQVDALSVRFFVDKKTPSSRGARWTISMSETVLNLFTGNLSNINIRKRAELREGLATFLYGYSCANDGKVPFKLEDLRAASGSQTKRLAAFAEQVREAMDTLVSRGCLYAYKLDAKQVRIYR